MLEYGHPASSPISMIEYVSINFCHAVNVTFFQRSLTHGPCEALILQITSATQAKPRTGELARAMVETSRSLGASRRLKSTAAVRSDDNMEVPQLLQKKNAWGA